MKQVVSVVIPTHNRSVLVQRAIESALAQTYDGVEVIVVDDGSDDDTVGDLNLRYRHETRVTCIATEHRGAAAARNAGLAAASGTHVAFLDSDDEWYRWKLQFQLDCLDLVPPSVGMIWTDMAAVDADGAPVARRYLRTFYRRHGEIDLADVMESQAVRTPEPGEESLWHGDLYRAMIGGNLVHTSTVMLTRDRLEAVGGFDEVLTGTGEDFDFHLRTCRVGAVAFADVPTMMWRIGAPDQLTRPDLMIQMARNHLTTIENAIAADDGRLSDSECRTAIAGAHAWLGEELLEGGSNVEARSHLKSAIRGRRRIRTVALFLIAKLPPNTGAVVRRFLASVTRPFRRR